MRNVVLRSRERGGNIVDANFLQRHRLGVDLKQHRVAVRHTLVVAHIAPVIGVFVAEQVTNDQQVAVRQPIGTGVAETQTAIEMIEKGQQLGRSIEADQGVVGRAAVRTTLQQRHQLIAHRLGMNLAAIAVLRIQNPAVLALTPLHALHELQNHRAFLDEIIGADGFQREQRATSHAEADRADTPVVHAVDLGADFIARRRADVEHTLHADLVGGHAQQFGPAIEGVHHRQDFVFLTRNHAGCALGGAHHQHVPDIPGEVVIQVIEFGDAELVDAHRRFIHLLEHAGGGALLHDAVAKDAVRHRFEADEVAGIGQFLKAQTVVRSRIALAISGSHDARLKPAAQRDRSRARHSSSAPAYRSVRP